MKRTGAAFLILFTLPCGIAVAGPPFATDDPEPTDYQHHEFYMAFQQTRTVDGSEGTVPQLEYNYGAAPDLQLGINVPVAFSHPSHGSRYVGPGDITLSAKYRFFQETESLPMAAVFPSVSIKTGNEDRGLGSGATQVFLPVWLQKSWGDWQSYGGAGYMIDQSAGVRNHWFLGWQLQKDLSPRLTLGGEVFHETEQVRSEGSSSGFNLGGLYHFSERNHLLFSAGRGLQNARQTNQVSSYLGYQRTW